MAAPRLVLDASVVIKWLLPEEGRPQALAYRTRYRNGDLELIAPHLLVAEIGNVLWKRVRRGELSPHEAQTAFDRFLRDAPQLVGSPLVAARALELANRHGRTVYDCLYLSLALSEGCDLITADQRLVRALDRVFPCVKPLFSR